MMTFTPEKTPGTFRLRLGGEILNVINEKLRLQKQTKKWLAAQIGSEYGRVKRQLSYSDMQPLTIDEADHMLMILGSSLTEVLTAKLISDLDSGIADILKRHYVVWE